MNFESYNHEAALNECQVKFDRSPYNQWGSGLPCIAAQIATGSCRKYQLTITESELSGCETLLAIIEKFTRQGHKGGFRKGMWSGLGRTLQDKINARRNIDYYRLTLIERLRYSDTDVHLGDENGLEVECETKALFPELRFDKTGSDVLITLHIPNSQ